MSALAAVARPERPNRNAVPAFRVSGLVLWASGFGFRVGFGLLVSGFGLRVSSYGLRVER